MNLETNKSFKKTAFTLVELLVVISIIAMLLAVLLPALNKAREIGKRTICMSNIKQLGTGTAMYCNEYKYIWWDRNHGQGSFAQTGITNYWVYAYNIGWFNHGKLFSLNLVKNPDAFYCKSDESAPDGARSVDYFSGGKLTKSVELRGEVRTGYMCRSFNPKADPSNQKTWKTDSKKPYLYGSKFAILSDRWVNAKTDVHLRYFNVLYGDCHVAMYNDSDHQVRSLGTLDNSKFMRSPTEFRDAFTKAMSKFGDKAKLTEWASGWLYFDNP
ncbi:MAG: type II secretion system protein [Phycisphaerales bacterium]